LSYVCWEKGPPEGGQVTDKSVLSSEKEWQFQFVLGKFSKVIFIAPIFVCSLSSMSQAVFARKQACSKSTADKGCWRVWEVDKAWGSR
jgi:hypothetical protein